jgi:uncharacterized Zn-binding protein involved in type VI secretion
MRAVVVLACGFVLAGSPVVAAPLPRPTPATEHPIRTIVIVLNGETLSTDTPPQVIEGRLLLPLRTIFDALGIPLARAGDSISAHVPLGTVVVTFGSENALVNDRPVALGSRVQEIDGITYVPLKFLSAALGATANYDQRGARVQILSAFIGRTLGPEERRADGGTLLNGVVSAIDNNSAPPSITVTSGSDQPRTIAITSDAIIYVEDVTVHSQVKSTLGDLHIGDQLTVVLAKDGRVVEIHDFYSSDNGTIAAVSPIAIVLQNGKVVQPARSTEILLNGAAAKLTDLVVGDYVTVRRNPLTSELRQIIASRTVAATPAAQPVSGDARIAAFSISATRPLRGGESLTITLQGTPGGRASFDIGDFLTGLDMKEDSPGFYRAQYTIPERFNVNQVPIFGHLALGSSQSPRMEANVLLSAATTPPQITDVAPSPNAIVNNPRPSIYAQYLTPAQIGINLSAVTLTVNGHDVTSAATRSSGFIVYTPGIDYADGEVKLTVKVADAAGNTASRTWSFTIRTH